MSESNSSSGIGFGGMLTIVFITLKLTHVITWSWWWVTVPVWGPLSIAVLVVICMAFNGAFRMKVRP